MLKSIQQFAKTHFVFNPQIYLAISGGVDSMVLSHCLKQLNIKHTLLHCNFKLRGEESDKDEAFIIDYANQNNLPCLTQSFDTKQFCESNGLTIQEGARILRYDWFNEITEENNGYLLTAHHLNDQIETFFINLIRGTGLKGLTGINNKTHLILRPLLEFSKQQIIDFAKANDVKYREDQSNESDNYLRNRLRHHLIPMLKEESNSFDVKMKTLFSELKTIDEFHSSLIFDIQDHLAINCFVNIDSIDFYPDFILVKIFEDYNLTRKKVGELRKLFKSKNNSILRTSTHTFLNHNNRIIIQPNLKNDLAKTIIVNEIPSFSQLKGNSFEFDLIPAQLNFDYKTNIALINHDKITLPLKIRVWQKGDRIQPLGMKGTKLVSDILKDKKMTRFDKDNQLVIECNGDIIWIINQMINDNYKVTPKTKNVLEIIFTQYN